MDDPIDQHPMRNYVAIFLGQFPHAAPDNPTIYRFSIAEIMANYPEKAVKAFCNPVTGFVSKESDRFGLPELRDLKVWLENWMAQEERLQRYAALPKPQKRDPIGYVPAPARPRKNLFVPEGFPGYDRMVARRNLPGGEDDSEFETRVCVDGATRVGILVPLNWYHEAGLGRRSASGVADVSGRTT